MFLCSMILSFDYRKNWRGTIFFFLSLIVNWLLLGGVIGFLPQLPQELPFFYSHMWGSAQLIFKYGVVLIPVFGIFIFLLTSIFLDILWKAREVALCEALMIVSGLVQIAFVYALGRIITKTAVSYQFTLSARLYLAGTLSFLLAWGILPLVRKLAELVGALDNPKEHDHPAILHSVIVPRAGALAFVVAFVTVSLIFLPPAKKLLGIYAGALVMAVVGVLDDRAASGKCADINPYLRLGTELLAASLVVGAGVGIAFFRNPFNGIIRLDFIDIPIYFYGVHHLLLLADLAALIWIVWVMNMLSWSNGVDGQFSGIIFVTFLVLCLISLRNVGEAPAEIYPAFLSAVGAGASLGLLPATWHPSRVLWGFGATACGLIIASVSVLSQAKVAVALLVLLVPALDALVAVGRRLLRGQSPVWGDSGHLHHHLLRMGLSQRAVAVLYWLFTFLGGLLALYAVERGSILTVLTVVAAVLFVLVVLNLGKKSVGKHLQCERENS